MANLSEIVGSLENRISKLLRRFEEAKKKNLSLEEELEILKSQQNRSLQEIEEWREKCGSLKLANSMLGSNQYKRETKLKINALVRELDQCISQLSE